MADKRFQVTLVVPESIVDLLDGGTGEEPTTDDAIKFAHLYLHAMGELDAPYLEARDG